MSDRKKPGVAFWATVALLVVLVWYPLSFGPACAVAMRIWFPAEATLRGQAVLLADDPTRGIRTGPDKRGD